MSVTSDNIGQQSQHDHDWSALNAAVNALFAERTKDAKAILTVNTEGLYETYLGLLPSDRQTHVCSACAYFFNRFAGLVCIGEGGRAVSALWEPAQAPDFYAVPVLALKNKVEARPVEGVFYDGHPFWGIPQNKGHGRVYHHFAVPAGQLRLITSRGANERLMREEADRASALKLEDYKTVQTALDKRYTLPVIEDALRVLREADGLNQSERFVSPLEWLRDLHVARASTSSVRAKSNFLWDAIKDAPKGYCHPASSVVGELLEDIASGLPFAEVKARFNYKTDTRRFQRATTAPSVQSIAEAEKAAAALGFTPEHFRRRYANLERDGFVTLWRPKAKVEETAPSGTGIFGRVRSRSSAPLAAPGIQLPSRTMTWEKFSREVLPNAEEIEVLAPAHGNFGAYLAPVDPTTPPLMKWGNSISGYVYSSGSSCGQWGLRYGWNKLTAIVPAPSMWGDDPKPYLGKTITLVIDGAMDTSHTGACFFPQDMIEAFSGNAGLRRVMESYSTSGTREEPERGNVAGLKISPNHPIGVQLRVRAGNAVSQYTIDRWD